MTSSDICNIIEAAGKAGVCNLKYRELEFIIGNEPIMYDLNQQPLDSPKEVEHNEADTKDEVYDDYDENQILTDPLAFEESAGEV